MGNLTITKMVYSYSRLSMFSETCVRQFYHKYIEGRPYPPNGPMTIGKIFHAAMEKVIGEGYSPEEAAFFAIYEANGLPEGGRDYYITSMMKKAYARLKAFENEYSDMVSELHLIVETDAGLIQLYLDIVIDNPVEDEVLICDFKTSWHPYEAKDSKQLALYAYLFKKMRGGMVGSTFKGRLIFPRCPDDSDTEVIFTDEILQAAEKWACNTIREIESRDPFNRDDWAMTSDRSKCEHCPYSTLCAGGMMNGLPGDGIPKDEEEAARIGEFILIQENAIKRMKDGLKAHVKNHKTPIVIHGGRWEFVQSEASPKIPMDVLRQFAEDHGLDVNAVLTQDTKTLKKWIDGDESGFLKAQATWTTPRSTFKFLEESKSK